MSKGSKSLCLDLNRLLKKRTVSNVKGGFLISKEEKMSLWPYVSFYGLRFPRPQYLDFHLLVCTANVYGGHFEHSL